MRRPRMTDEEANRVFFLFRWQTRIHACICEAFLAVLEGYVRCPFYVLAAIVLAAIGSCRRDGDQLRTAVSYLREAVIFLVTSTVLMIPGWMLFAYTDFNTEEEQWNLRALPTCIGRVDPRRYYVVSRGQGAWAWNGVLLHSGTAYTMDTVPGSAFALQASGGVFQSANEEGQFLAPEGADTSSEDSNVPAPATGDAPGATAATIDAFEWDDDDITL